jgi:hypoxia up-regulated 1
VPPRQEADASSTASAGATSGTPEAGKKDKKDKKNKKEKAATPLENTIPLNINVAFTTIAPMTIDQKRAARSR